MVYWTYNPLNMFRALLCPSSGARDCTGDYSMWHITLCLKLVVWSGVGLWAVRPEWRMLLEQYPSSLTHNPQRIAHCSVATVVHRQGDDSCCECNRCACARFRVERRVAITHPESICRVQSLTTRCSNCLMFSVRVCAFQCVSECVCVCVCVRARARANSRTV